VYPNAIAAGMRELVTNRGKNIVTTFYPKLRFIIK